MSSTVRVVRSLLLCASVIAVLVPVTASAGPPTFPADCGFFGPAVNPVPRPCLSATNVSVNTSIYFEATQNATPPNPDVNPNTLTATLQRQGGPVVPMLNANQQFAPGFTGTIVGPGFLENPHTWGVQIVPSAALTGNSVYTVTLNGQATDGTPMPQRVWNFTTRRALGSETASFNVDLASATVTWKGFWYSGIGKPDFDTSLQHDQGPLYDQIAQSRQQAPDLFAQQRDFPLLASGWTHPFFDGAPNIVREQETRQVTAINTAGGSTTLTTTAMAEGALFGIDPDRQANSRLYLEEDYITPGPNVQVLVCDQTKCQQATVQSVNENLGTVTISALTGSWTVQPPTYGGDSPDIPDQFPYSYTTLRRLSPSGTLVYYWTRLDDEWDTHVVGYNRRPHVNFFGSPFELCRLHNGDGVGGVCPLPPKDWHQWDAFVQAVVLHVIDRYTNPSINPNANPSIPGHPVIDWYYAIANEPDLSIFWAATVNEMLEYYDYTANAMLRAFEARGINTNGIKIGGVEIGLVNTAHPSSETPYLYHASPTVASPGGTVHEGNYVCENPSFNSKRAARINALCTAPPGNKGVPLDFVSVHTYSRSADAAARLIAARDNALAIDATYFANTAVNSHETVPDWVPHKDPDSKEMYRWGGYFSSWATDYFRRLLARAVPTSTSVDARYANGEAVITTWPPHNNFSSGITSIGSNLYVDDNDDAVLDRIVAIANPFFRVAELMARMPRTVAPFPTAVADAGVDIAGFRAVGSDADWLLLYAHDRLDTGDRETGVWNVTLNLSNSRFPVVKVTEYRIDRTHPAKAALAQLGIIAGNQMYGFNKSAQVDALAAADDLVPAGAPVYMVAGTGGTLQLTKPLYAQGVVVLELSGKCGNGTVDPGEQCDDHNNANGDCCSATCFFEPNGTPCNDFNACTAADTCNAAGVCQPGACQVGAACAAPPCGAAGHCLIPAEGGCACGS